VFDHQFDTAPAAPTYTALGGLQSIAWNPESQALDVQGGTSYSLIRFNEVLGLDFWFEADIEVINPSLGEDQWYYNNQYTYVGISLTSGSSAAGWAFRNTKDLWVSSYWPTAFSGETKIGGVGVSAPYTWPSYLVGNRQVLRVEYLGSPTDPTLRVMRYYVDGKLCFQHQHTYNHTHVLYPCVCTYDSIIRIHRVSSGSPSGIPLDLQLVDPPASTWIDKQFSPLLSPNGPSAGTLNKVMYEFDRLNAPVGDWSGKKHHYRYMDLSVGKASSYYRGTGEIVGTLNIAAAPDNIPVARRVQLIDPKGNTVVRETWSDAQGNYLFHMLNVYKEWTVMAYDYSESYRSVVADRIQAVATVQPLQLIAPTEGPV